MAHRAWQLPPIPSPFWFMLMLERYPLLLQSWSLEKSALELPSSPKLKTSLGSVSETHDNPKVSTLGSSGSSLAK
jgi:hypothetical protein